MALNKDSNGYVLGFSIAMVLVVGTVLAVVATALKGPIEENKKNEKKQYILAAAQVKGADPSSMITRSEAQELFEEIVVQRMLLDGSGNVIPGTVKSGPVDTKDTSDCFNMDINKAFKKFNKAWKATSGLDNEAKILEQQAIKSVQQYPLYVLNVEGHTKYVMPCAGVGLWDAIWGYVCLDSDGKSICGAVFDHKAETAGLGSEIAEDWFEDQFLEDQGKSIDKAGAYSPIVVVKPGSQELDAQSVDGISGGTFTSAGVDEMLKRALEVYYVGIPKLNELK